MLSHLLCILNLKQQFCAKLLLIYAAVAFCAKFLQFLPATIITIHIQRPHKGLYNS